MEEKKFTAKLETTADDGAWTYITWPESAEFFGTRKSVKVAGTIDGQEFKTSFLPMGGGVHMLPVKAAILSAIDKKAGDTVEVHLKERL
ncbi:DUF1905 domain-containing protein [Saccharothrix hoggarensis]|uniref:DUF1905 domain-containing protein n=1 Tax=Saccharothrix hoggarensis TaxID=913853 RepID=A0ABW3QTF2_9PSEU